MIDRRDETSGINGCCVGATAAELDKSWRWTKAKVSSCLSLDFSCRFQSTVHDNARSDIQHASCWSYKGCSVPVRSPTVTTQRRCSVYRWLHC